MSDIVNVSTIAHKKFTIPIPWNTKSRKKVTYYIAKVPIKGLRVSNFQIHRKIDGDDDGYAGSVLAFLMEDGSLEEVKGPFYEHKDSQTRILYDILTGDEWPGQL